MDDENPTEQTGTEQAPGAQEAPKTRVRRTRAQIEQDDAAAALQGASGSLVGDSAPTTVRRTRTKANPVAAVLGADKGKELVVALKDAANMFALMAGVPTCPPTAEKMIVASGSQLAAELKLEAVEKVNKYGSWIGLTVGLGLWAKTIIDATNAAKPTKEQERAVKEAQAVAQAYEESNRRSQPPTKPAADAPGSTVKGPVLEGDKATVDPSLAAIMDQTAGANGTMNLDQEAGLIK